MCPKSVEELVKLLALFILAEQQQPDILELKRRNCSNPLKSDLLLCAPPIIPAPAA